VESEEGKGSRFIVNLPVSLASYDALTASQQLEV
jgi:chemotaxis protein histidine kinase CheA